MSSAEPHSGNAELLLHTHHPCPDGPAIVLTGGRGVAPVAWDLRNT